MKKAVIISIFFAFVILSCERNPQQYIKHSGPIQGTFFNITYCSSTNLNLEIDSLLQKFNKSLSNYDSTSLISQINRNETDSLDSLCLKFLEVSREVWAATDGLFDVSVAPIVNAWGFGWKKVPEQHIPDSTTIDSLLQYVGMDKIWIENGKIKKQYPQSQIITNAIAQGLSVDYISNYLKSKGVTNFLVEIGGEIYCNGKNPKNKNWKIGIDKPIENSDYTNRENQIIIELSDKAVNTSGNYRKFLSEGKNKYGHSINPKTGLSSRNEMLSASVIYPDCVRADAYATAFMIMGAEKALQIVNSTENMEAYFIVERNGITESIKSSGFDKIVSK